MHRQTHRKTQLPQLHKYRTLCNVPLKHICFTMFSFVKLKYPPHSFPCAAFTIAELTITKHWRAESLSNLTLWHHKEIHKLFDNKIVINFDSYRIWCVLCSVCMYHSSFGSDFRIHSTFLKSFTKFQIQAYLSLAEILLSTEENVPFSCVRHNDFMF